MDLLKNEDDLLNGGSLLDHTAILFGCGMATGTHSTKNLPLILGGGGFNHGIAGNMSDIQQMPYRYGDQGGIQQMPYTGGVPSLIDFGKGLEALKKGKERGGVMNDSTYEALQMLQGY